MIPAAPYSRESTMIYMHSIGKAPTNEHPKQSCTERPAWKALAAHHQKIRDLHLRKLFADDPERGERMTVEAAGLFLDYSKNRVTDETLKLLVQLATESGLREHIDAMFRGEKINITENARGLARGTARAERRIDH